MLDFTRKARYGFDDLVRLVALLRAPGGCPWDGVQTHQSIRRNFLEEAYEACEGFDRDDAALMREELGDVLLQVVFHADIERAAGRFTVDDVCDGVCKKLIFRHPALFSDEEAPDWETLKRREKGQKTTSEAMDGVAKSLPALWRAEKLRKKAGALPDEGSDEARLGKLEEEVSALRRAFSGGGDVEQALGGVLFAAVCAGMNRKADPERALHRACEDFIRRFARIERAAAERGLPPEELPQEELLRLWADEEIESGK